MGKQTVLTLDAGGTNFVFNAICDGVELISPVSLKTEVQVLDRALDQIKKGFDTVIKQITQKPNAISFAFPGPADYQNGIISNDGNLPAFKGEVPLKEILEKYYQIPVFINNDGDLFTLGEAEFGALPELNSKSIKKYKNLLGITLGTGYGAGLCINGQMFLGDNSNGLEVWTTRNGHHSELFTEEGVSKRAISYVYGDKNLSPFEIYQIAQKEREGDQQKAIFAFREYGKTLGESLADLITLFDSPIVIGGGIKRGAGLFMPEVMNALNGSIQARNGEYKRRIVQKCYFLEDESDSQSFYNDDRLIKKIPIMLSKLGTNRATQLGAYAFAVNELKGY